MQTLIRDIFHLVLFLLAEIIGRFPVRGAQSPAINGLARLAYTVSGKKRRRIEYHLDLAYEAELSPEEKKRITLGCFREFWREMVDWVPGSDKSCPAETGIRGLQHLENALGLGKGVILWESNGFSRRIRGKQVLHAHNIEVYQTHGVTHLGVMDSSPETGSWICTRFLRPLYERRELRFIAGILPIQLNASANTGLAFLELLRRNRILCLAGDGQIAQTLYPVPFLGRTVGLAPGAVKLARATGATLLPIFWKPAMNGTASLEIEAPVKVQSACGENEDFSGVLQCFASALESRVRRWPECYRNWHHLAEFKEHPTT